MLRWRRFERTEDGTRETFSIYREGIRCFELWGVDGTRRGGSLTYTLDDEDHAQRHLEKKVREKLRKGFVEIEGRPINVGDPDALVVDTIIKSQTKDWFTPPPYLPVHGIPDAVCQLSGRPEGTNGFYHYLLLLDQGRSAIGFNVRQIGHNPEHAVAFLNFVSAHRDLPFDGRSHHKLSLPEKIGQFGHALFCSPPLGRTMEAYPAIARRVALAFPIVDYEIGDDDPEVLVDARTSGRGSMNYSDWVRAPQPVFDARGFLSKGKPEKTFKVYEYRRFPAMLALLRGGGSEHWLEIRNFRSEVLRLEPPDVTDATADEVDRFVTGRIYSG